MRNVFCYFLQAYNYSVPFPARNLVLRIFFNWHEKKSDWEMGTNQPNNVELDKEKDTLLDQNENFQQNQNQFSGRRHVEWKETESDYSLNFDEEGEAEGMSRETEQRGESLREEEDSYDMLWVETVKNEK